MPTYAYKCTACENSYETKESFDSPPRQPCPVCGEVAKRVIFPPPIVFKGSGFYVTDSRKGESTTVTSEGGASSADSSASSSNGDTSGSAKTESAATPTPTPAKSGSDDA